MWSVRGSLADRKRACKALPKAERGETRHQTRRLGTRARCQYGAGRGSVAKADFSTRATPILRAVGVAQSRHLAIVRRERCEPSGY